MKISKLIIRFWKVGKLLHLIACLALIIAVFLFSILMKLDYTEDFNLWFFELAAFICFFNMCILAELDGYSRFQNYKQLKDQMYLNGYQERQLKPLLKSSCQRQAATLAADELGFGKAVRCYFYSKGYRWYHIIPDFVINNPLFFFTVFFWRTTFFTPYYEPEVNYDQLELSQV